MSGVSIRTPPKKSWTSCIIKSSRKLCSGFPEKNGSSKPTQLVFFWGRLRSAHFIGNPTVRWMLVYLGMKSLRTGMLVGRTVITAEKKAQKHGVGLCFVYFTDIFYSKTWLFQQNGTNKGSHKCLWLSAFSKGTFFPVWSAYCHIMVQLQEYRVKSRRDSPWSRDPAKWPNGRSPSGVNKHQVLNP